MSATNTKAYLQNRLSIIENRGKKSAGVIRKMRRQIRKAK